MNETAMKWLEASIVIGINEVAAASDPELGNLSQSLRKLREQGSEAEVINELEDAFEKVVFESIERSYRAGFEAGLNLK